MFFDRRWMLGEMICVIVAYVQFIPNIMELVLMAALPLQRLYVMQWPLRSLANASKRRKLGILLSAGLWTLLIAVGIAQWHNNGKQGVEFSVSRFICQPLWLRTTSTSGKVIRPLILILFQVAPLMITMVANVWVLVICSRTHNLTRTGSQLKTKSLVTILIVTTLFVLSVFPGTVLMILVIFKGGHTDYTPLGNTYIPGTLSMHLSFINVVSNYYVFEFSDRRRTNRERIPYPRSRSDVPSNPTFYARNGIRKSPTLNRLERDPEQHEREICLTPPGLKKRLSVGLKRQVIGGQEPDSTVLRNLSTSLTHE